MNLGANVELLIDKSDAMINKSFGIFTIEKFPVGWAISKVLVGKNCTLRANLSNNNNVVNNNIQIAINAFTEAINVPEFNSASIPFASCQNEMGNALHRAAVVAPINERAHLFRRAVAAYKVALVIRTETDFPLEWATTENNLANTRRLLAEFDFGNTGTNLLSKAVKSLRLTLQIRTLEDYPLDWASTKNNLGAAAAMLAERLGASAGAGFFLLLEARKSFSDVQTVYTRQSYPSHYAVAEANMGRVLEKIGDCNPLQRAARYPEALASYDLALEVFGPNERGPYRAECTRNRAGLLDKLAALR